MQYLDIKQASNYLNVSPETLEQWETRGLITPIKSKDNQSLYTEAMLDGTQTPLPIPKDKKCVIGYCRVSSIDQQNELAKQEKAVTDFVSNDKKPFILVAAVASADDVEHNGIDKLINAINTGQCAKVVFAKRDCFADNRLAWTIFHAFCNTAGVEVTMLDED